MIIPTFLPLYSIVNNRTYIKRIIGQIKITCTLLRPIYDKQNQLKKGYLMPAKNNKLIRIQKPTAS